MIRVEKSYHFHAAHRNKAAGEKCARIHGHTYHVECCFSFPNWKDGITILFQDLDSVVEPIIKKHCHYLLLDQSDTLAQILEAANEPFLALPFATTAENIAKYLFEQIAAAGAPITKITLAETTTSTVIYEP